MHITVEACCGSAADVIEAALGGADRAELNTALELGGLTPTPGALRTARASCGIPVMVMLRPRAGGFCYDDTEYRTMLSDAEALLSAGADGLVFGILTERGTVDRKRCARLASLAHDAGKEAVFHRALDVVPCWEEALDALADLGIDRVLTSGQAASAPLGMDTLSQMVRCAAGRIAIMPGGGIRRENALQVVRRTGCTQIHLSARTPLIDPSMPPDGPVRFNSPFPVPENSHKRTDAGYFRALKALLEEEK